MRQAPENVVVVIPVFQPGDQFPELLAALAQVPYRAIVVVNDGSGPDFDACFQRAARIPRVELVEQ